MHSSRCKGVLGLRHDLRGIISCRDDPIPAGELIHTSETVRCFAINAAPIDADVLAQGLCVFIGGTLDRRDAALPACDSRHDLAQPVRALHDKQADPVRQGAVPRHADHDIIAAISSMTGHLVASFAFAMSTSRCVIPAGKRLAIVSSSLLSLVGVASGVRDRAFTVSVESGLP